MKYLFMVCLILISKNITVAQENYQLNKGHSHFGFEVERFLVGEVNGRFNNFDGRIVYDSNDITSFEIKVEIKVESIDSNNETRDGHLKGKMWFDSNMYPTMSFSSKGLKKIGEDYVISGLLTIKDVTKEIEVPVEILGPFKDPTKKTAIGVKGSFKVNRREFGFSFDRKFESGEFLIGDEVNIKFGILAYGEE